VLATWSVQRLAEQTVVIPVDAGNVGAVAGEVAAGAGGVILFGAQAPADLASSLARLVRNAPSGIAPLIMTDEEGGAVQRMANLVGWIPSARQMAATMTPAEIQRLALGIGRRMQAAGVTMDLAPVLDLDGGQGPNARDPVGTRSFSPVAKTASADGLAFAAGLRAAGVVSVAKHFPGLGGATGNTDFTAAATLPWSSLQTGGLLPFQAAIRARIPAVMVANASVPGLTNLPASISPAVITTVLCKRLGFSGLVVTDSLSAGALRAAGYSVPRASVHALAAGADMVLYTAMPARWRASRARLCGPSCPPSGPGSCRGVASRTRSCTSSTPSRSTCASEPARDASAPGGRSHSIRACARARTPAESALPGTRAARDAGLTRNSCNIPRSRSQITAMP
jgi:beta-N-acetylhexosaminidase